MEKIYYSYENGLGTLTTSDLKQYFDAEHLYNADEIDYTLDEWIEMLINDCTLYDFETFYHDEIERLFFESADIMENDDNIDFDELKKITEYGNDLFNLSHMGRNKYGVYTDEQIRIAVKEFKRKYN